MIIMTEIITTDLLVVGLLLIIVFTTGCVNNQESHNTVIVKDVRVINNVPVLLVGDFCPCSILADDGVVYTANKESCVKLPVGMNATVTTDLETAKWTGYRCAIYKTEIHL